MAASSYYYYNSSSCSGGFQSRRRSANKSGLRGRCVAVVKQQKTRFYILGRCVSMLLCWHAHSLSD